MTEVKLSSKLPNPRESDKDGLRVLAEALLKNPKGCHLVVALVNAEETTTRHHDGAKAVKVGVEHIEVIADAGDQVLVEKALLQAYRARTGQGALPLPGMGGDREGS